MKKAFIFMSSLLISVSVIIAGCFGPNDRKSICECEQCVCEDGCSCCCSSCSCPSCDV